MKNLKDKVVIIGRKVGRIVLIAILIAMGAEFALLNFIAVSDWRNGFRNVAFCYKRPDIIAAGRMVAEQEEQKIQQAVASIKKSSVKQMLAPLVVAEAK